MKVIDQINGSALFAQSAYSASIATKDELSRDITATYLTAHQDLSDYAKSSALNDYQTIEGMTAYQEAGEYYSASNPSGFISEIPATVTEATNYVTSTSGNINDTINNVTTNSGVWNEISAISGTYMVTYGTTTLSQISNAIGSGLDVYCRYNDGHGRIMSAPLASTDYGAYTFTTTFNDSVYYFAIEPNGDDGAWSVSSKPVLTAQTQSDWNVTDTSNPAYIKNKPDLSVYTTSAQVSAMIQSACDTKFVAELYTTPYNEILSAYNEGKTIVLSPVSGNLLRYDELSNEFTFTEELYIIDDWDEGIGHTSFQYYFVNINNEWRQYNTVSNVQSDWNQSYSNSPDYIKNKPDLSIYTTSAQVSAMVESADNLFKVQAEETPFSAIEDAGYEGKCIVYRRGGNDYKGICLGVGGVGIPISFLIPFNNGNQDCFYIDTVDNEDNWTFGTNEYHFNVQADWNQTLSSEQDYIKNKPDLEDYAKASAFSNYVAKSATEVEIGDSNSAVNYSLAQGYYNSANTNSFAQGTRNYAYQDSLAQGIDNSATQYSVTQGKANSAYNYGVAIGSANSASNYSQAFGKGTIATASGLAIGTYNKTDSAAFVIGDGVSELVKSDSFIVYNDGSVSAKGKISAAGVELGAGGGGGVPQSAFDELKASYDALSSLFATYSGQWLLPNEGEE